MTKPGDSLVVKKVHYGVVKRAEEEELVPQASYVEDFVITTKTGTVYRYTLVNGKNFSRFCVQVRDGENTNLEDYAYVSPADLAKLQAILLDPDTTKNPNKLQGMVQVFREKDFRGAPGRVIYLPDYKRRINASSLVGKEPMVSKRKIALY